MKSWYQIQNKANNRLKISLHDEIGMFGVSAAQFLQEINVQQGVDFIDLDIHSPGGNMLDGIAIYNGLKAHPANINTHVTGIAASAASTVLMAGDVVSMPEDAFIMIHNPSGFVGGESDDMREVADVLDKFKRSAINIYAKKTGKSPEEVSQVMQRNTSTWFSAEEALEFGLVDKISPAIGISNKAAQFVNYFSSMPFVTNADQVSGIKTIKDFERFLRDSGGLSRGLATALSSRAKTLFQSESEPPNSTEMQELSNALERMKIPVSL